MDVLSVYRERGEPAPIPKELRRWYTKAGDLQKGPLEADAITRALKDGHLKSSTLVRPEDEIEWRPVGDVLELRLGRVEARRVEEPPRAPRSRGNFWVGFWLAVFAGLVGFAGVYVMTSGRALPGEVDETRRGARVGLAVAVVVTTVLVAMRR